MQNPELSPRYTNQQIRSISAPPQNPCQLSSAQYLHYPPLYPMDQQYQDNYYHSRLVQSGSAQVQQQRVLQNTQSQHQNPMNIIQHAPYTGQHPVFANQQPLAHQMVGHYFHAPGSLNPYGSLSQPHSFCEQQQNVMRHQYLQAQSLQQDLQRMTYIPNHGNLPAGFQPSRESLLSLHPPSYNFKPPAFASKASLLASTSSDCCASNSYNQQVYPASTADRICGDGECYMTFKPLQETHTSVVPRIQQLQLQRQPRLPQTKILAANNIVNNNFYHCRFKHSCDLQTPSSF